MPRVTDALLKGNYGAALVMARLSQHCLVRPVAADTDIGIDLYCETVSEDKPFLHFWMQVKTGTQCLLDENKNIASCSFSTDHLEYWSKQPVPVFAALVPVGWPIDQEPDIYIVDLTSRLLMSSFDIRQQTTTLASEYRWPAKSSDQIRNFISTVVPFATARLQISKGIVASEPTLRPQYEQKVPYTPITKYKEEILHQIRRTAANSILFLENERDSSSESRVFRKLMADILELYDYDSHWENFMARGLSYHHDEKYNLAAAMYERACESIESDSNVCNRPGWISLKEKIRQMQHIAISRKPLG